VGEKDGNWDFAAYELVNLRGAFDRLKELNSAVTATNSPRLMPI
jgi:hypothetical protein